MNPRTPDDDQRAASREAAHRIFPGPGAMCARCREFDWAATPLGPADAWPPHLVVAAQLVLGAGLPMALLWGRDGAIIYNDSCAQILGDWSARTLGRPLLETVPTLRPLLEPVIAQVWEGETVTLAEQSVGRDAARRWFTVDFAPVRDGAGEVAGAVAIVVETTARVRADAALRESATRSRMIVEGALDYAILTADPEGRITSWSPGAAAVFGWSAEEVLGELTEITFTAEDRAHGQPAKERAEARANGTAPDVRWHQRKDGTRVFIDGVMRRLDDDAGGLRGFLKIGQDVTERRRTEELAAQLRVESERVATRRLLVAAEEEERGRLSRELHDQLGQHLTALMLGLVEARRLADVGESVQPRLTQLEELAQAMTRDARHLALELRPPELDDVGLESAVATYVERWGARYGVTVEVAVSASPGAVPVPPDVATALYRIVQEALTNVARHAQARLVSVLLDRADGEVRLVVEDDGTGFDAQRTMARARHEGRLGLAGMHERATLVGGSVEVESAAGQGTTVFVRVPLRR